MMYMIRNIDTGKYSKGGIPVPTWTDKIDDAKVWKKKSFVKSHITNVRVHRERYGHRGYYRDGTELENTDIRNWLVIEAEIVPRNTYMADNFT